MWTCPKCNERLEDQFDSCWKCAASPEHPAPNTGVHDAPARLFVGGVLNLLLLMWLDEVGKFSTREAQIGKQFWLAAVSAIAVVSVSPTIWYGRLRQRLIGALLCVIPLLFLCWAVADHFGWPR